CVVILYFDGPHGHLRSFPTRRSSDLAPVLLNIVNISALIPLATFWVQDPRGATIWVALATMLGGIAQLWLVWVAIERTGFRPDRSEEHTSELQSRENLVCRLLLEKKK